MYKKIKILKNNIKMVKTKKIVPMNPNLPSYKRTQLVIMPPKYDPNVKPEQIFEGFKKTKKKCGCKK